MLKEKGHENFINHCKHNVPNKFRLNAYKNYSQYKGYYVLTKGKYRIIYATCSFHDMHIFIKEHDIPFYQIHLNNMTYDELFYYMHFDREFGGKI